MQYAIIFGAFIVAVLAIIHFHLLPKIEALLHKHAARAPVVVNVNGGTGAQPVPGGQTQVPPPSHGANPPANSGSTGSLVGQPVPGGDTPDSNGAIAIPAIAAKFAPGSRFLTVASLPYVAAGSAAAFCIAANCANTAAAEQISGLASVVALAVVQNPPSATAVGFQAFHLANGVSGEPRQVLPNVVTLSPSFATVADIVAKYQNSPNYGSQGSGSGFPQAH